MESLRRIVDSIESEKNFRYFIAAFFFTVTIRFFMEVYVSKQALGWQFFLHNLLFYSSISVSIITFFYLVLHNDIIKIAKIVIAGFSIIMIVPVLDFIISHGKSVYPAYLWPQIHDKILLRFLILGGSWNPGGITPGIKIELVIVLVFSFLYLRLKGSSVLKSLLATFLEYALIFMYACLPIILAIAGKFFGASGYIPSDTILNCFFVAQSLIVLLILAYFYNREQVSAIVRDMRFLSVGYHYLLFILGFVISLQFRLLVISEKTVSYAVLMFISVFGASVFSIITNNLVDKEIDEHNEKKRPLSTTNIPQKTYESIAWISLFVSLFCALIVGFYAFILVTLLIGGYYLYSMPPLKVKRVLFLSKIFLSFSQIMVVFLGFYTLFRLSDDNFFSALKYFPLSFGVYFFIGTALILNFRDIIDFKGDEKAGIKTLSVLAGLKISKIIIGILFILFYSLSYIILKNKIVSYFIIFLGIIQLLLVNKKNYSEKCVMLIHGLFIFSLILNFLV
jgi:4-hydroxybenzoate polyprenyltransferase